MYLLFCGISRQMFKNLSMNYIRNYKQIFREYQIGPNYFPIQFSPASDPFAYIYHHPISSESLEIAGRVAEFGYAFSDSSENKRWILHTMRPDRDIMVEKGIGFGNDFKIAEMTFGSYSNPFGLDKLSNPDLIKQGYFEERKLPMYKYLTKFNAFVKARALKQLEDAEYVIDLASGKGQDLFVYHGYGVKNILFTDVDIEALNEINFRRYNLGKKQFYVHGFRPNHNMSIRTKQMNIMDWKIELKDTPEADGIVINFAIRTSP